MFRNKTKNSLLQQYIYVKRCYILGYQIFQILQIIYIIKCFRFILVKRFKWQVCFLQETLKPTYNTLLSHIRVNVNGSLSTELKSSNHSNHLQNFNFYNVLGILLGISSL